MDDKVLLKELGELSRQYLNGLVTVEEVTNAMIDKLATAGYIEGVVEV